MELDSKDWKKLKNTIFKQGSIVSIRYMDALEVRRAQKRLVERIYDIEANIGANMNYNRDIQDDNYRYNKLRTKVIAKRKRQEARTDSEGIY